MLLQGCCILQPLIVHTVTDGIQFSWVQSLDRLGHQGTWQTIQQRFSSCIFCGRFLWAALAWAVISILCCPSSISSADHGVAHPPNTLKDGFGDAAIACDVPEPYKFPSVDSCQKRFLWTHKEVDLVPYQVVGLVLQVGDTEKFPQVLGFESLDPFLLLLLLLLFLILFSFFFSLFSFFFSFSESASKFHVSQLWKTVEVTKDLYSLNLLAKLVLHRQILVL